MQDQTTITINQALKKWAQGSTETEAGMTLLIDWGSAIYDEAPWINFDGDNAWMDVDLLLKGDPGWSSGELAVVQIAASLLGLGPAIELCQVLSKLDQHNSALVLQAFTHVCRSKEA